MRVTRHHSCRVSPFGHPRIHARLTAPRGISQPPTSFIGSQCQGIHHAPLNTYKHKNQLSKKKLHINTQQHPQPKPKALLRARCSQPLSTNQTPHPTTKDGATTRPPEAAAPRRTGLLSQSPIVCLAIPRRPTRPTKRLLCTRPPPLQRTAPSRPHLSPTERRFRGAP